MNKIFIGGIAWTVTDEELEAKFLKFGNILQCKIVKDKNGRSQGYGFITYQDERDAQTAKEWDGQEVFGRILKVSDAIERY